MMNAAHAFLDAENRSALIIRAKTAERERDAALLKVRLMERQIEELLSLGRAAVDQRDALLAEMRA